MCYNGLEKSYHRNLSKQEIIEQVVNIIDKLNLQEKYKKLWFSLLQFRLDN